MEAVRVEKYGKTFEFNIEYLKGKEIDDIKSEQKHVPDDVLELVLKAVNGNPKPKKKKKKEKTEDNL